MKLTIRKLILVFLVTMIFSVAVFGQTLTEKGIELYNQKRYAEAAGIFKKASKSNKKDAEIWNYLGLSYFNNDKYKSARKAFIKAIKLSPQNAAYRVNIAYAYLYSKKRKDAVDEIKNAIRLDPKNTSAYFLRGTMNLWQGKYEQTISDANNIIALDKNYAPAYMLKTNALLGDFGRNYRESSTPTDHLNILQNAIETLESCRDVCRNKEFNDFFETKMMVAKGFYDYYSRIKNSDSNLDETGKNRTPIKILSKPLPGYTNAARSANYGGSITLAVLFAADGKTKYAIALNSLDYGLAEAAFNAAAGITFEPELIDGKPVSVVRRVQYTFDIY